MRKKVAVKPVSSKVVLEGRSFAKVVSPKEKKVVDAIWIEVEEEEVSEGS